MNHAMRKPVLSMCKYKGTDQLLQDDVAHMWSVENHHANMYV